MRVIQETEDIKIYRDFFIKCDARYVQFKESGEVHIYAEDLARAMGFQDVHSLLSSERVLARINFHSLEKGVYPMQTMDIKDAACLFDLPEGSYENVAIALTSNQHDHPKEAAERIAGNGGSIGLAIIKSNTTLSSSDSETKPDDYYFELQLAPHYNSVTLTQLNIKEINDVLSTFKVYINHSET